MGLDISAYSKVQFVNTRASEEEIDEQNLIHAYNNPGLPVRLDSLSEGYYKRTSDTVCHSFRAGSYGGYNWWRHELSRFSNGVDPVFMWDGVSDSFKGKPFAELINFSDCEGAIGPETSAKLSSDFEQNRAKAVLYSKENISGDRREYWLYLYDQWHKAFLLAADDGLVIFH